MKCSRAGALPRSRDRGRPLGLATATGLRAGRSVPSQPPLLLARGERRSARDTQRSRAQRARKQARAFWWGARSALGAPGLVTVQTDNPATEYVAPALSSSRTYDYVAPAPVIGYIAPASAAPCSRDYSEASAPMVVGSPLRLEGIAAPFFSQVYQEQIVAGPVQYAAPTMTGTRVDVNRNGSPDVRCTHDDRDRC